MTGPGLPTGAGPTLDAPPGRPGVSDDNASLRLNVVEADPVDDDDEEGARVARRLLVAGIAIAGIAVLCWVVLPQFGLVFPPFVPLMLFGVIVFATIVGGNESRPKRARTDDTECCESNDEGRPICCSGPRPPRIFK